MRPNVLWVMCDQLRGQALGCAGDPNAVTPRLDRLAAAGARFETAVSQYPVCTPFRGGLVTGRHASANGCRVHGDLLPPSERTVAHAFNDAGYRTGWVGKWHLGSVSGVNGFDDGGDYWVHPHLRGGFADWIGFDSSNHFYHTRYSVGREMWPPRTIDGYQTDGLTDLFLDYLDDVAADERPFFVMLSLEAPHPGRDLDGVYRHAAPPEYLARHDPARIELRGNVPERFADEARQRAAGYYAQIENLDHNVGRVLDRLDELGLADDTIIMFFSDHGEMLGSHGMVEKMVPRDESLRIPWLARGPGIRAGRTINGVASGLDIAPTTAALANVAMPGILHGHDHTSALRGDGDAVDAALIQWLGPALQGFWDYRYRALRTPRHLYSVGDLPEHCLLFDYAADPLEQVNLFDQSEARAALHARLVAQVAAVEGEVPMFLRGYLAV
jgi:arylsulfatase A-like enzyme